MIDVIENQENLEGLFHVRINEKAEIESFHSRYEVKEELGKGLTSIVCRCVDKFTGKQYAVKIVNLYQNGDINIIDSVNSEVSTLTTFPAHPNIISLVDVYRSEASVYILLELAPNGELFDFCNKHVCLTERFAAILVRQLFLAVNHLHQHDIVHRDIKMENLLMDEKRKLKLTDFGFAKVLKEGETLHDLCGTLSYIAPEVLKAEMGLNIEGYSFSVDMWSCGILLYTLLVGQPPFYHRKKMQLMRKIQSCSYDRSSESWTRLSAEAKNLVESLLVLDVSRRLTAAQALQHPWIKNGFS